MLWGKWADGRHGQIGQNGLFLCCIALWLYVRLRDKCTPGHWENVIVKVVHFTERWTAWSKCPGLLMPLSRKQKLPGLLCPSGMYSWMESKEVEQRKILFYHSVVSMAGASIGSQRGFGHTDNWKGNSSLLAEDRKPLIFLLQTFVVQFIWWIIPKRCNWISTLLLSNSSFIKREKMLL